MSHHLLATMPFLMEARWLGEFFLADPSSPATGPLNLRAPPQAWRRRCAGVTAVSARARHPIGSSRHPPLAPLAAAPYN